jgi:two-component system, chemotaxis family, protein-glutamate methylesterase/glutaminase
MHMSALARTGGDGEERRKSGVLIVDDSVVARGLISRWVGEHPRFEVVGTAADGVGAIRACERHRPAVIVLDLDMPVMDGLTALPELLKVSPGSSVLIASSLTARSARLSMQCLALGAADLQPKPDSNRDLTMSPAFRQDLLRKIEALADAGATLRRRAQMQMQARPQLRTVSQDDANLDDRPALTAQASGKRQLPALDITPRVLLIGASTGGPRAIGQLLEDFGSAIASVPVLITQHMPTLFTASFAEHLRVRTGKPAREAADGDIPLPGHIYVAPGGRHLRLERHAGGVRIRLDDSPPVKFCRPSVDVMFSDAAHAYGASALGVILTGMGADGVDGVRLLRDAGARILVQDEDTSVVWGMPGAVSRAGLAHAVLPIGDMGGSIAAMLSGAARP